MNSKKSKAKEKPATKKVRKQRLIKILIIILAAIVIFRIILPVWVLNFVNNRLAEISGYFGHVENIDICLYRGAYQVKELYINRVDSATQKQTELFTAPLIDISLEWKSLLKGRIVTELEFQSPTLKFTKDRTEPEQMEKDTNDFRKMLKAFTPTSVNRFEVFDGRIAYVDPNASPPVDIYMTNTHILARNLSNVVDTTALPAKVEATSNVYGGRVKFNMRINALADDPTYDMNVELKGADLTRLNDFFKAYADFDVNKGTFGMYMEMAAKDRKFIGYVKPFINDLDVVGREDRKDNILRKIWESIVGVAGEILEAPRPDQIATKVPIAGAYDDRTIGIWYAIWAALRNGIFKALMPTIDNQVNLQTTSRPGSEKIAL